MKILLANTSFLPSYAGPAYSVSRLALALAEAGVEVGVWAPDQSAPTTPLILPAAAVQRLSGGEVEALRSFGKPDVLHDNGIGWRHHHRLADLAAKKGIPRIVSTRGMLEPWALKHKRWKKRVGWWLYRRRDLKRALAHHTTAKAEANHVRSLGLRVPLCVIQNGVDVTEIGLKAARVDASKDGQKTALFLGRIYPVKGLPMLVEAWGRVRPPGWRLQIVGPDEAGHRAEVEKAVLAAGLGEAISFLGPVHGEAKRAILFDADLFVLPTHSENFGMAIGEALAHGLPVLTTTAAPWSMLLQRGCGWSVEPTVDGIAEGLQQATLPDSVMLREMGAKGREFVEAEFARERIAKEFVALYADVNQIRSPPNA